MTKLKISDFKMFEKAAYDIPEVRTFTELAMEGVREVEKMYGPVFTVKYIRYALWFIAQKIGEEPPQDVETIDQLKEYLISKADKYPTPYCACTYAQAKTESVLQGRSGAGTRIEVRGITAPVFRGISWKEKNFDVEGALLKIRQMGIEMKVVPSEMGYKKNEDGSVDLLWPKCPLTDGCKLAFEEDLLKRMDGRVRCVIGEGLCRFLKLGTGYEWDYDLLEFDKPHCIQRYYML